jgi:hypothetical protein
MYAVYPQTVEPFAQHVRKIIQEKNLEAWRKLYDIFEATSQDLKRRPISGVLPSV